MCPSEQLYSFLVRVCFSEAGKQSMMLSSHLSRVKYHLNGTYFFHTIRSSCTLFQIHYLLIIFTLFVIVTLKKLSFLKEANALKYPRVYYSLVKMISAIAIQILNHRQIEVYFHFEILIVINLRRALVNQIKIQGSKYLI